MLSTNCKIKNYIKCILIIRKLKCTYQLCNLVICFTCIAKYMTCFDRTHKVHKIIKKKTSYVTKVWDRKHHHLFMLVKSK